MSFQATEWVLAHSPTRGAERLVLFSLANHAGGEPADGAWESWPGIECIAREAGLDRPRTVRDVLGRLVANGHVERVVNGAPDRRLRPDRRPNLYRILLAAGVPCESPQCCRCGGTRDVPPRRSDGGTRGDRTGGRAATERGDARRPNGGTRDVPLIVIEQSEEQSLNRGGAPAPPGASAARATDPRVKGVLDAVWNARRDRGEPVPGNYLAARGVVAKLLAAGWDERAVTRACDEAATISVASVELQLRRPGNGRAGAPGTSMIGPRATLTPEEERRRRLLPAGELTQEEIWGE